MREIIEAAGLAARMIFSFDASLFQIVALSLSVSLSAVVVTSVIGVPLGAALAVLRFHGRRVVVEILNALLGLPPVVVGLVVYMMLSHAGPFGALGLLFTPQAMVIAQAVLVAPIVIVLTQRAVAEPWALYGDALVVDGTSRLRAIPELLAMNRPGLVTAFLAGFGRAIAEVGAIIRRRQYCWGDAHYDHRSRAGNQQGQPAACARTGNDPNRDVNRRQRNRLFTRTSSGVHTMIRRRAIFALLCLAVTYGAGQVAAAERYITVASTTSTEQSGLFGHLLPAFTAKTGIEVHVVAVGTGQALEIGKRGDCDVVFVHDRPSELAFAAAGFGVGRREVMYNDFVLVGPKSDPAGVSGLRDITAAFGKIATARAAFISRGDDSGTDKAEKRLWHDAGIDVHRASGTWYRDTGSGMGQTPNTAAALEGYMLADRGTWLSFQNRRNLVLLVEGDKRLFNQYGVMLVNPARHPNVKRDLGQTFIDWLVSAEGQRTIASYKINGEQLFFPNAATASN